MEETIKQKAMKVIIIYDTEEEAKRALKSTDLCDFISTYQHYLRSQHKYADPPDDIEKIYEKWFEILSDCSIDLDDIYS